ncbi:MAG: MarR family winged helix-turn-helix transcriptional regulator [Novosphingobium sp.]
MSDQTRLADFLPYLLSVTSNAVSDRIADEYRARFGLKIPEWRVMAVLGDAGPLTQRELVGATRMDKVAVNRACKVLEERGLLARSPNARDGRSHHLELTGAGRGVHGEIMPIALDMERRLFAPLSTSEVQTFKGLLARIYAQAISHGDQPQ